MLNKIKLLTLPFVFAIGTTVAHAAPIPYVIEFTVTSVYLGKYCPDRIPTETQRLQFDCDTAPGDKYVATFMLSDDSILNVNGLVAAPMEHFFSVVGGIVWAQDFPSAWNGTMTGDLGGLDGGYGPLGVEVLDGEIVGFARGAQIRGPSPIMFLGFFGRTGFYSDSVDFGTMRGDYVIRRVPEPTWVVLLVGLLLAYFCFIRRTVERHRV